ncbi:MAG: Fe(3+) ABC transporter substrate-binding protein [Alphaproteobacteria bacterium]
MHRAILALAALVVSACTGFAVPACAAELNIYSTRQEHLIRPLLDAFSAETGIKVNLVSGGEDALFERLRAEGANSPADLFLTVDVGRLVRAKLAGMLQPLKSTALETAIPAELRDPEGEWFGLSVRARVIFHAKDRVKAEELSSYAALADSKWKGRICVRSSSNVYNQSLLAAMIATSGAAAAENWAKAMVANFARPPQGGDRDQILAVAAGACDIAVANTYYFAGLLQSQKAEDRQAAAKLALFWPDQKGRGAHINVSGAGVTKGARNKAEAQRFLEFLSGDMAQRLYAEAVYEFPVRRNVAISGVVADFGAFKSDTLSLAEIGKHQAETLRIFDRVGWR